MTRGLFSKHVHITQPDTMAIAKALAIGV